MQAPATNGAKSIQLIDLIVFSKFSAIAALDDIDNCHGAGTSTVPLNIQRTVHVLSDLHHVRLLPNKKHARSPDQIKGEIICQYCIRWSWGFWVV
jgi:hypothetical protein